MSDSEEDNTDGMEVISQVLFYGNFKPTTAKPAINAVTAEDFIQEMKSRKTQQGWSDKKTQRKACACLREEARKWYEKNSRQLMTEDEWNQMNKSFAVFEKHFKKEYCLTKIVTNVDWADMSKQHKGEALGGFITRVFDNLDVFFEGIWAEMVQKNAEPYVPPVFVGTIANLVNGVEDPDVKTAAKASLRDNQDAGVNHHKKWMVRAITTQLARKTVIFGLHDEELRKIALDYNQTIPETKEFFYRLKVAEIQMVDKPSTNNHNNHRNNKVHELSTEAGSSSQADAAEVEAVRRQNQSKFDKANNPRKGKGKGKNSKSNSSSAKCNYCLKPGHLEKDCYTKEWHEKNKLVLTQASQVNTAQQDAQAFNAEVSALNKKFSNVRFNQGNANGGW